MERIAAGASVVPLTPITPVEELTQQVNVHMFVFVCLCVSARVRLCVDVFRLHSLFVRLCMYRCGGVLTYL